jgi:outer membrane protein OmpA-like peptidoglycan-associated protein
VKRLIITLMAVSLLIPFAAVAEEEESWEDFRKARAKAETLKFVPKKLGGLISKDVIIEQLQQQTQTPAPGNTAPGTPGQPGVPGQYTLPTQPGQPMIGTVPTPGMPMAQAVPGQVVFASDSILFEYGSARMKPMSFPQLMIVAAALRDPALASVPFFYVDGHTCDIGSDPNNCRLSWDRAREVIMFLTTVGGVNPIRLRPRGFGERIPMYPNANDFTRSMNRRVALQSGSVPLPIDMMVCSAWSSWRGNYGAPYDYSSMYQNFSGGAGSGYGPGYGSEYRGSGTSSTEYGYGTGYDKVMPPRPYGTYGPGYQGSGDYKDGYEAGYEDSQKEQEEYDKWDFKSGKGKKRVAPGATPQRVPPGFRAIRIKKPATLQTPPAPKGSADPKGTQIPKAGTEQSGFKKIDKK